MSDSELRNLERNLLAEPTDLLLITKYCNALLRATDDLIQCDVWLTSHVAQHQVRPVNAFKRNYLTDLLNLGLEPGFRTKVKTSLSLRDAVWEILEALAQDLNSTRGRLGEEGWVDKLNGVQISTRFYNPDLIYLAQQRTSLLLTEAKYDLLQETILKFSYQLSSTSRHEVYSVFFPRWILEQVFAVQVTQTHKGFSRSNTWYEAETSLGSDWNNNQINNIRRLLAAVIEAGDPSYLSSTTLVPNGMFELSRYTRD